MADFVLRGDRVLRVTGSGDKPAGTITRVAPAPALIFRWGGLPPQTFSSPNALRRWFERNGNRLDLTGS